MYSVTLNTVPDSRLQSANVEQKGEGLIYMYRLYVIRFKLKLKLFQRFLITMFCSHTQKITTPRLIHDVMILCTCNGK